MSAHDLPDALRRVADAIAKRAFHATSQTLQADLQEGGGITVRDGGGNARGFAVVTPDDGGPYSLEPGRMIVRDGKPIAFLMRWQQPDGGSYALSPADADALARRIVDDLNRESLTPAQADALEKAADVLDDGAEGSAVAKVLRALLASRSRFAFGGSVR